MARSTIGTRMLARAGVAAAVAIALVWPVFGQPSGTPPVPASSGYLGRQGVPDDKLLLPPPPADTSIIGKADLDVFRATRAQQGGPRWQLATRDAAADPASMLDGFGCALGVKLRPGDVPAFSHLMQRTMSDAVLLIGPPKDRYHRPRPFLRAEGPVCTPLSPEFSRSGSYPSGHSTVGWLYALILTELAPDRGPDVLARGRVFGESRVICGVHYVSDVEAGHMAAADLVALLDSNPAFRADLEAARAELERVRRQASSPDSAACAVEREASSARPW